MSWSINAKGAIAKVREKVENEKSSYDPDQFAAAKTIILHELDELQGVPFVNVEANGHCYQTTPADNSPPVKSRQLLIKVEPLSSLV